MVFLILAYSAIILFSLYMKRTVIAVIVLIIPIGLITNLTAFARFISYLNFGNEHCVFISKKVDGIYEISLLEEADTLNFNEILYVYSQGSNKSVGVPYVYPHFGAVMQGRVYGWGLNYMNFYEISKWNLVPGRCEVLDECSKRKNFIYDRREARCDHPA